MKFIDGYVCIQCGHKSEQPLYMWTRCEACTSIYVEPVRVMHYPVQLTAEQRRRKFKVLRGGESATTVTKNGTAEADNGDNLRHSDANDRQGDGSE